MVNPGQAEFRSVLSRVKGVWCSKLTAKWLVSLFFKLVLYFKHGTELHCTWFGHSAVEVSRQVPTGYHVLASKSTLIFVIICCLSKLWWPRTETGWNILSHPAHLETFQQQFLEGITWSSHSGSTCIFKPQASSLNLLLKLLSLLVVESLPN